MAYTYTINLNIHSKQAVAGSTSAPTLTSMDYVVCYRATGAEAAYIYNNCVDQTNFSDLAVFWGGTQIDVDLDQDTYGAFSTSNICIWFKLQQSLCQNDQSNSYSNQYTLQFGSASPTTKNVWDNIYNWYDKFAGTVLDSTKWTASGSFINYTVNNGLTLWGVGDHWQALVSNQNTTVGHLGRIAITCTGAANSSNETALGLSGFWAFVGLNGTSSQPFQLWQNPSQSNIKPYTSSKTIWECGRDVTGAIWGSADGKTLTNIPGNASTLAPGTSAGWYLQANNTTTPYPVINWFKVRPFVAIGEPVVTASIPTVTSRVQLLPTGNITGGTGAGSAANLYDNDLTTFWQSNTASANYVGEDLGAAAIVTQVRVSPRIGPVLQFYESTFWDIGLCGQDDTSNDCLGQHHHFPNVKNTGPNSQLGYLQSNRLNEIFITPDKRRYWTLVDPYGTARPGNVDGSWFSVAELQLIGPPQAGINSRPLPPVIGPWGFRSTLGSNTVTLSCPTIAASIYYTTDGTIPTTSSTLYTGPFTLNYASGTVTLKAIAYDAGQSTTLSTVSTAYFNPKVFQSYPNARMYDIANGNPIQLQNPTLLDDTSRTGKYFLYGFQNNMPFQNYNPFMMYEWCYSSTDCQNWQEEGHITLYGGRANFAYNPNNGTYCGVGGDGATSFYSAHSAFPNKGWTAFVSSSSNTASGNPFQIGDTGLFVDDDGSGYFFYDVYPTSSPPAGTIRNYNITKLASDYQSIAVPATYTQVAMQGSGNTYESPVMFKRSGVYYLEGGYTNNYDSTLEMHQSYAYSTSANPLSGWVTGSGGFGASGMQPYVSDPIGTGYNVQQNNVTKLAGYVDGYVHIGDYWVAPAAGNTFQNSQIVFAPITFPSADVMQINTPISWDLSYFTPALAAGTITETGHTATSLSFSSTSASGGTPPYTYAWYISPHGASTYTLFGTGTSTTATGLTASTSYDIRCDNTDSTLTTVSAYALNISTDAPSPGNSTETNANVFQISFGPVAPTTFITRS